MLQVNLNITMLQYTEQKMDIHLNITLNRVIRLSVVWKINFKWVDELILFDMGHTDLRVSDSG